MESSVTLLNVCKSCRAFGRRDNDNRNQFGVLVRLVSSLQNSANPDQHRCCAALCYGSLDDDDEDDDDVTTSTSQQATLSLLLLASFHCSYKIERRILHSQRKWSVLKFTSLSQSSQAMSEKAGAESTAPTVTASGEEPKPTKSTVSDEPAQKIPILLRPIGSAPLLTKNRFHLSGTRQIVEVEKYLRKTIQTDKGLFLYCGTGFSPTPDQQVQDLFECFQIGGDLVVMYGIQEQYG